MNVIPYRRLPPDARERLLQYLSSNKRSAEIFFYLQDQTRSLWIAFSVVLLIGIVGALFCANMIWTLKSEGPFYNQCYPQYCFREQRLGVMHVGRKKYCRRWYEAID